MRPNTSARSVGASYDVHSSIAARRTSPIQSILNLLLSLITATYSVRVDPLVEAGSAPLAIWKTATTARSMLTPSAKTFSCLNTNLTFRYSRSYWNKYVGLGRVWNITNSDPRRSLLDGERQMPYLMLRCFLHAVADFRAVQGSTCFSSPGTHANCTC